MAPTSTSQVPVMLDLENRLQHGIFEQSLTCVASGIVNMMTPEEVQDSAKDRIFCRRLIIAMTRQKYTVLSSELLSRRASLANVLRVLGTEEREELQQLMVKLQCKRKKLKSLLLRGAENFWECKGDTQLYGEDWKDKTVSELYPTTQPDYIPEVQRVAPSYHSMRAKRKREYNLRRNASGGVTSENSGECKDQKVSGASCSKDVKDQNRKDKRIRKDKKKKHKRATTKDWKKKCERRCKRKRRESQKDQDSTDRRRKNKRTRDQEDDSLDNNNDRKKTRTDNTNQEESPSTSTSTRVCLCQNTKNNSSNEESPSTSTCTRVCLCQNTTQINDDSSSSSSTEGQHVAGQNSNRTPINTGPSDAIVGVGMRRRTDVQNATPNTRSMMEVEVEIEVPSTAWERNSNDGVEELFGPLFE
ncbi:hypothetical protein Pmani_031155 [Petrolisthes manimaculis]|uniref:Uncharacterized protein n=1 Tax=Petrolisthes manimaculis TaxID=1843537 RepID=A0AAE1NVX5_9EUCA|nr:hypothetical protein Pmani_031155 [Petrolisthes manimaculis]